MKVQRRGVWEALRGHSKRTRAGPYVGDPTLETWYPPAPPNREAILDLS
jgi:hypothetical protein